MQSVTLLTALSLLIPLHSFGRDFGYSYRPFHVLRGEFFLLLDEVIESGNDSDILPNLAVCVQSIVNCPMLPKRGYSKLAAGLAGTIPSLQVFSSDENPRNMPRFVLASQHYADLSHIDIGSYRANILDKLRKDEPQLNFQRTYTFVKVDSIAHRIWHKLFDVKGSIRFKQQTRRRPNIILGDMEFTAGPTYLPVQGSDLGIGCDVDSTGQVKHDDCGCSQGQSSGSEHEKSHSP